MNWIWIVAYREDICTLFFMTWYHFGNLKRQKMNWIWIVVGLAAICSMYYHLSNFKKPKANWIWIYGLREARCIVQLSKMIVDKLKYERVNWNWIYLLWLEGAIMLTHPGPRFNCYKWHVELILSILLSWLPYYCNWPWKIVDANVEVIY